METNTNPNRFTLRTPAGSFFAGRDRNGRVIFGDTPTWTTAAECFDLRDETGLTRSLTLLEA